MLHIYVDFFILNLNFLPSNLLVFLITFATVLQSPIPKISTYTGAPIVSSVVMCANIPPPPYAVILFCCHTAQFWTNYGHRARITLKKLISNKNLLIRIYFVACIVKNMDTFTSVSLSILEPRSSSYKFMRSLAKTIQINFPRACFQESESRTIKKIIGRH